MPKGYNNFKTVHNTGTITLVVDGKAIRSLRYTGCWVRSQQMKEWTKMLNRVGRGGYIEVKPDWDLWNHSFLEMPSTKNIYKKIA